MSTRASVLLAWARPRWVPSVRLGTLDSGASILIRTKAMVTISGPGQPEQAPRSLDGTQGHSQRRLIASPPARRVGSPSDTDRSAAPHAEQVAAPHPVDAPHPDPLPVASAGQRGEGIRAPASSESGPSRRRPEGRYRGWVASFQEGHAV